MTQLIILVVRVDLSSRRIFLLKELAVETNLEASLINKKLIIFVFTITCGELVSLTN